MNFYILKTPNRSFSIVVTVFSSTRQSGFLMKWQICCDLNVTNFITDCAGSDFVPDLDRLAKKYLAATYLS